jgi:predicted Zn-dependent peptidase
MSKKMMTKKEIILKNGFKIISLNDRSAITATALVVVKTGSKYESRKENGLSHFLEHLFFKGTKKRPNALALSSELDSLGSEYNAFTGKEYTGYYIKVASGRLSLGLDILADMLSNPLFPKEEISREKGVVIEEIKMYEDNPLMHIEDVFETCLYGDTPAGWEVIGTRENVSAFSHQMLFNYYKRQYGANSMTLILSGAINNDDLKVANQLFSKVLKNPWREKQKVSDGQIKAKVRIIQQKIDQANLSLGVRAVPVGHPQEVAIKLLSFILGGSMSSRLFVSLRERRGLAYYIKTIFEQYSDSAYLTTQAGVPKNKLKEAIKVIVDEYKLIAKEGISQLELKRTKDMAIGRLKLRLEGSDDLANWYGKQVVSRKKLISPEDYIKKLKAVSLTEINQVANNLFNKPYNLAIIANIDKKKESEFIKLLEN